jgi:putative ABC transport system permease protein
MTVDVAAPVRPALPSGARLPPRELAGTAVQGLRTRRLRAALSALGIAIGIGAMVAVVGVSASAQANLIAEIDRLGTNLLTVTPGTSYLGQNETLPTSAAGMVAHMLRVDGEAAVYQLNASVYRSPFVPAEQNGGISVVAVGDQLPEVLATSMAAGHFLDPVSDRVPEVVLGAQAAQTLDLASVNGHVMVYLGSHWFSVIGIMRPFVLDDSLNSDVFISLPMARTLLGAKANPSTIYVRAAPSDVTGVAGLLPATADPQDPSGVNVSRPSDALEARAAAKGQFTTLLLGLGAVTLLVGAIGIANIMVISVLERRGEIGLRRALGATRRHISVQFLTESALLAALGGVVGLALGAAATAVYAVSKAEPFVVPSYALIVAPAAGFVIGALAGVYPAMKAARLSPTEALRA